MIFYHNGLENGDFRLKSHVSYTIIEDHHRCLSGNLFVLLFFSLYVLFWSTYQRPHIVLETEHREKKGFRLTVSPPTTKITAPPTITATTRPTTSVSNACKIGLLHMASMVWWANCNLFNVPTIPIFLTESTRCRM